MAIILDRVELETFYFCHSYYYLPIPKKYHSIWVCTYGFWATPFPTEKTTNLDFLANRFIFWWTKSHLLGHKNIPKHLQINQGLLPGPSLYSLPFERCPVKKLHGFYYFIKGYIRCKFEFVFSCFNLINLN